jgi:hypothetical protein
LDLIVQCRECQLNVGVPFCTDILSTAWCNAVVNQLVSGELMRFIALTGLVLLASLQVEAQVAQTADDKSHEVSNVENAWNQALAMHDEAALKGMLAVTCGVEPERE